MGYGMGNGNFGNGYGQQYNGHLQQRPFPQGPAGLNAGAVAFNPPENGLRQPQPYRPGQQYPFGIGQYDPRAYAQQFPFGIGQQQRIGAGNPYGQQPGGGLLHANNAGDPFARPGRYAQHEVENEEMYVRGPDGIYGPMSSRTREELARPPADIFSEPNTFETQPHQLYQAHRTPKLAENPHIGQHGSMGTILTAKGVSSHLHRHIDIVLTIGKVLYTIVKSLQPPNQRLGGMNDGIHVIKHPQGELRVLKTMKMTTNQERWSFSTEKKHLQQIAHAGGSHHINHLFEGFWPENGPKAYLVLEFCDMGSLLGLMNEKRQEGGLFAESFMWHILAQMSAALSMTHFGVRDPLKKQYKLQNWNCIAHLDIKLDNVFLSSKRAPGQEDDEWPRIVLGDFGLSVTRKDIEDGLYKKDVWPGGTQGWYPPENQSGDFKGRYGKPTDIWQMGGVVQAMCRLMIMPNVGKVYGGKACSDSYSFELNHTVASAMMPDPKVRPTAVDVAETVQNHRIRFRYVKTSI